MVNWVNIATIDNITPFYRIGWKEGVGSGDAWFAESSGLTTDSGAWNGGTTQGLGYYTYHRFNSSQYTCTFIPEGRIGYGKKGEYGESVEDKNRDTLPTEIINGDSCYVLDLTDWQGWIPLYAPYSTMNKYSNFVIYVDLANPTVTLAIEPDIMEFAYTGGSSALTITTDEGWTASTSDSWLTLSSTAGTGDSTITITAAENGTFQDKLGTIAVTDGSDTLTCSISQEKRPILVKSDNIYIENTIVNKMYLNGSLIYCNLIPTVVFDVDESSETIAYNGGTFNFTVYANKLWTITSPEWVTLSKTSGYSTNTITATVGQNPNEDIQRTGTITVSCNNTSKTISLTQSSAPHDYSKEYLTFDIISGGTIIWRKNHNNSPSVTISYSINNGNWVDITSNTSSSAPTISVNTGDKVRIKGNNNAYCATGTTTGATSRDYYNNFSGDTSAKYNVEGNIMSLIYGDNFIGNNEFPDTNGWNFKSLFENDKNVISAKNLILPPTTLYMSSFRALFSNASNLEEGPELLAPVLAPACYSYIFGTTKIQYVKCLATDISAAGCLYNWLYRVHSGGTFVKKTGVTYPNGASGIPNGWTVINTT